MILFKGLFLNFIIFVFPSLYSGEVQKVELTYYWRVPASVQESITHSKMEVKNSKGEVIGHTDEPTLRKIWIEGSGFINDGKLINLVDAKTFETATYMLVDKKKYPWGLDARGNGLKPLKTIAVDPEYIPLGSTVYIPEFEDNGKVPLLTGHNGCFIASDTGHSFKGKKIDLFSGSRENYILIEKVLKTHKRKLTILLNHDKCS